MIPISPRAMRDIRGVQRHYLRKERPEAVDNLLAAVHEAADLIEREPDVGKPYPGAYPQLERRRILRYR